MDILEARGETITYCGPSGAGQTTKACNQIVVAEQMVGVREAQVFAAQAGPDLEAVVDVISGGAASCWTLDNRAPDMIRGDVHPGFFAEYQYKDLSHRHRYGRSLRSVHAVNCAHTNSTKRWCKTGWAGMATPA